MDLKAFVKNALASGRTALTEAESKTILGRYGVPVKRLQIRLQTRLRELLKLVFPWCLRVLSTVCCTKPKAVWST